MRKSIYPIMLTDEERDYARGIVRAGRESARVIRRANMLLMMDEKSAPVMKREDIAASLGVCPGTVYQVAKQYCQEGLPATLTPKRTSTQHPPIKIDGVVEAHIVQIACSKPPEGRSGWTLQLIADRLIELRIVDHICPESVRKALKNELHPHQSEYWCIPPKQNAQFVACMEDVLDLYQMPYDPEIPMICMDEKPYQLIGDVRAPLPVKPTSCEKVDHEYKRNGTCSIFLFCEPLTGKACADASEHRTREDWAHQIHRLLTVDYPHVRKVRLVMDQLNTHAISSLYMAFPPMQARTLASRLEIHHTPKHGSWLNIAECYLSVLSRQCLNRRIPDLCLLASELRAWNDSHAASPTPVIWRFSSTDARIRLRSLYPVVL